MKLTKLNTGIFEVSVTIEGRRIRKSTGERTKSEATKRAIEIVGALRKEADECHWTLDFALRHCYERVWSKAKNAVHNYGRIGKIARDHPAFANKLITEIDFEELEAFTDALETAGAANSTINRFLNLISKALSEAVKRKKESKLMKRPEFPYRPEDKKGKPRWMTWEEEQMLADKAREMWPENEANGIIAILYVGNDTGGRLSEMLRCPRHSVGQVTYFETKNGEARTVPLTDRAQTWLPRLPFWTAAASTARFTRLSVECGLHAGKLDKRNVTIHTTRHTCASRLVQGDGEHGMDLYRVKEWMGHSSITVTQRYAHLSPSHLRDGTAFLIKQ